jgi:hypothetical protein
VYRSPVFGEGVVGNPNVPQPPPEPPSPGPQTGQLALPVVVTALTSLLAALGITQLLNSNAQLGICLLALLIAFLLGVLGYFQAARSQLAAGLIVVVCVGFMAIGAFSGYRSTQSLAISIRAEPRGLGEDKIPSLYADIGPKRTYQEVVWADGAQGQVSNDGQIHIDVGKLDRYYRQAQAGVAVKCTVDGGPE